MSVVEKRKYLLLYISLTLIGVIKRLKFTLEQATKVHRWSAGIAQLFL
jgi:hypothetical protein